MPLPARVRGLIRSLFLFHRVEAELDEELQSHLEILTEENLRAGMPHKEAERAAKIAVGNADLLKEQVREARAGVWLWSVLSDIRYAARGLFRNRAFSLTAIVSLSLAIGANTAIYSIVDAAMFRPLPVASPDQLFRLAMSNTTDLGTSTLDDRELFSYPLYEEFQQAARGSAQLGLFDTPNRTEAQASGADGPYEQVLQQFVSPNAFDLLGVSPALGQLLSPRDDYYPSPRTVAVLSYSYWQRRFGGDSAALGKTIILDGRPYSVIGVVRKGFTGVEPGKFVDVWLPVTLADPNIFTNSSVRLFHLLGRLAPGVSREGLAVRLQPVFHHFQEDAIRLDDAAPSGSRQRLVETSLAVDSGASGISAFRGRLDRPLWMLMGVSVCILLIACANVASLLLARFTSRLTEMAVRVSLGASRLRLVRQLMTESMLISCIAGFCGWLLAEAAGPALIAIISTRTNPLRLDLALNPRVLLFGIAVGGLSALLFGVVPAWQGTRAAPVSALRHMGDTPVSLRAGRLFVAAQVAFAFLLVTGGAGFLYSLHNLGAVKLGFDPAGVTVLTIDNTHQRDHQLLLMQQIRERVAGLPGVRGAASGWMAVFSGSRRAQKIAVPGQQLSDRAETLYRVSPEYFATLRIPLLSGRDFVLSDNDNEPVPTIVNRTFAKRYFGSDSVVGRQFRRDDGVLHQIVGLAADSHFGDLRNGPEAIAYMPMKPPRTFTLYVRSSMDAGSVAQLADREARALGLGMRVSDATTVQALIESTLVNERVLASLAGAFAFLGLALAAIGIFGLLNYSVTRRTKEFGVRTALGAQRSTIYRLVVSELMGMIAGGAAVGLIGALVMLRAARSLLFGVGPADPLVIGTAVTIFTVTAIVAAGLPARRAACVDPMVALRYE